MSSRPYEIAFRLGASVDSSLRSSIDTANRNLSSISQNTQTVSRSLNSMRLTAKAAAIGFAVFKVAQKSVEVLGSSTIGANANMEQYLNTLTVVMKSHKKAAETLAWAKDFANKTPFETDEIVDATAKLSAYGINARKILPQVGDMSSVMGKSLDQGVEAIADAQTGELERLKEFGITKNMIQEQAGKMNLKPFNNKGSLIDQEALNKSLFAIMKERYSGGMKMQSQTWKGMLSNIRGFMSTATQQLSQPLFQKLENGLRHIMPLFDGLTGLMKGDTKSFTASLNQVFGSAMGGMIANFAQKVSNGTQQVGKWANTGKQSIKVLFDYLKGDNIGAINIMTKMGLSTGAIVNVQKTVNRIKGYFNTLGSNLKPIIENISRFITSAFSGLSDFWSKHGGSIISGASKVLGVMGAIIGGVGRVFGTVFNVIKPVLKDMGSFIMSTVQQVAVFWNQNGSQIIQAVRNVFTVICAIIKFLAPVIVPIIMSIWGNVKGVIQGALKIIMGVIKIFAGLFTGDFRKMWEGIKQLFFGAIQFVWNAVNLLFVGKIIGSIRSLGVRSIGFVRGMWGNIKNFFTGGATNIWGIINHMAGKVTSGFNFLKQKAISIATGMWSKMQSIFGNIIGGTRSLPGRMGSAIKSMAGKAWDGIKTLGNKMLSGIGTVINGVIRGLNWILPKLGIKLVIDQWKIPQYANGTNGHPGGPAIVGDGGGPELIRTPAGKMTLSPAVSTLVNLPKGSEVLSYQKTKYLMNSGLIPAYGIGTNPLSSAANWIKGTASSVWNGAKNLGSKAGNGAKTIAGKAKDISLNVWSYIDNPSKLLSKVLGQFGVKLPNLAGIFKNIGSGAFSLIRGKALGFLKGKMAGLGNFKGGAAAPAQVKSWIMAAIQATGVSPTWLGALTSLAMHESGGNPRSINLWDSNAKAGHPSKGLMQTIDSTFNAYKMNGMNNIWNPIHNAAAAIRYMLSRYGSIGSVPGISNMAKGKGYVGYANGGEVPNTQWAIVGEHGPELRKLRGGSQIFSNKKSGNILSNLFSFGRKKDNVSDKDNKKEKNDNQPVQYIFSPTYVLPNGEKQTINEVAKTSFEDFKKFMKRYEKEKKRLEFV